MCMYNTGSVREYLSAASRVRDFRSTELQSVTNRGNGEKATGFPVLANESVSVRGRY